MGQPDHGWNARTGRLTSRFREAFSRRDIDTLRTLYSPSATSVPEPGVSTSGAERAAALDHFSDHFDTCGSVIRHACVADGVALLVVDRGMSGPGQNAERVRIEGAATDIVRRFPDGEWRYVIDNPFGSGSSGD